ncbi:uncharacterized protein, partial [Notothenia coriiceps]|uniref:CCHC-type domain-containing protein n=1 Tax=Notothenia coriiceps TaxID=8208 RepID=A0A6I9NK93_9TELE
MTELIRAVSLQPTRRPSNRVCWGCGQPGHLARDCPKAHQAQGNDVGQGKGKMRSQAQNPPNQTTALLPPTQTSEEGARQHSRGNRALLLPEEYDSTCLEPVVAVGRAGGGDSCYAPVTVEGVPCTALVDTGSTVTLVRADVLSSETHLEPTAVRLRTVTGELVPMRGKGMLTVLVGGVEVHHPVWIADVQDPYILGLDFLRASGCHLDLQAGTVSFHGGPVITMTRIHTPAEPAGRPPTHPVKTRKTEPRTRRP